MPLSAFTPAVRDWFGTSFDAPTRAQRDGWKAIAAGDHSLILAPTGSGKTLAAFLLAIDRLSAAPPPEDPKARTRVLYVSPLRALAVDIEKNLRAPLAGIQHAADRFGTPLAHAPEVAIRTGDTPSRERQRMIRRPPDILITTPESLYLMLTSSARETLRSVRTVIVDEIHAMAASKRGAHLSLSLERLEELCDLVNERLEPLRSFVLPGGTEASARLHIARSVCRRAERATVALAQDTDVNPAALAYLNRLSDLLFILARAANRGPETLWKPGSSH